MIHRLYPPFLPGLRGLGLLALRLVAGSAMMLHGWPMIKNALHWMGPEAPVPPALQAAAAVAEFGGGICWILGLATPLASLLIMCTMAVAISTVHIKAGDPFVGKPGQASFELAAVYLSIAVALLVIGPGKLSVDELIFTRPAHEPEPPRPTS